MKLTKISKLLLILVCLLCAFCISCATSTEPEEHEHSLTFVDYVQGDCVNNGKYEHYKCRGCDKLFKDAEAEIEVSASDLIAPPDLSRHSLNFVSEKSATCSENGVKEHYECRKCHSLFLDNEGKMNTTVDALILPTSGAHTLEFVQYNPGTCLTHPVAQHYKCNKCDLYFYDEFSNESVDYSELILTGYMGKHLTEKVNAVKGNCSTETIMEHYKCTICYKLFMDESCDVETTEGGLFAGFEHDIHESVAFVQGISSTCTLLGTKSYYECNACHVKFLDEKCTNRIEDFELEDKEYGKCQSITKEFGVKATCCTNGMLDYWRCTDCGTLYFDESGNERIEDEGLLYVPFDPTSHVSINYVPEVVADCYNGGIKAYYTCYDCTGMFSDSEGKVLISDLSELKTEPKHNAVTFVPGTGASCNTSGEIDRYNCMSCGQNFRDEQCMEYIDNVYVDFDMSKHNNLMFIPEKAPTCYEEGLAEHYLCNDCGRYYADEQTECEIFDTYELILPMSHSNVTYYAPIMPTCMENGNIEYWSCMLCMRNYADEQCSMEIYEDVIRFASPEYHTNTYFEAKKPTCIENGHREYYYCDVCEQKYDEFMQTLSDEDIRMGYESSPYNHVNEYVAGKNAGCKDGNIEHYKCTECGMLFDSEWYYDGIVIYNENEVILPATGKHNLNHIAKKNATCTINGIQEHYKCLDCEKLFSDVNGEKEVAWSAVEILAQGHSLTHFSFVDATCEREGNIDYWYCTVCQNNYAGQDASEEIANVVVSKKPHEFTFVQKVEAGCETDGILAHYHCSTCNKDFEDEKASKILESTVISKTGHKYSSTFKYDEYSHWNYAICEHSDLKINEKSHEHAESVLKYPTCTEKGITKYSCSCGHTYSETNIDAIQHNLSHVEGKNASCTQTGIKEHWYCSNCKVAYADEQAIEKLSSTLINVLSHTYNNEYTVDPYNHRNICSVCSTEDKSAHTFDNENVCTVCKHEVHYAQGLELSENNGALTVMGLGSFSGSELYIAPSYDGKPVTALKYRVFSESCEQITKLSIPTSVDVSTISDNAFAGLKNLEWLYIPDVTKRTASDNKDYYHIGWMFGSSENEYFHKINIVGTWNVYMPIKLKHVVVASNVLHEGAFSQCKYLETVSISQTATVIPKSLFSYCTSLTTVKLGPKVTVIDEMAFQGSGISSIIIPQSVKTIGVAAFGGTVNLKSIELPALAELSDSLFQNSGISEITVPSTVKKIGGSAFSTNSLKKITFLAPVSEFGYNPFGLSPIEIVNVANEKVWLDMNFTSFDQTPFINAKTYQTMLYVDDVAVTNFVVPDDVSEIKPFIFYNHVKLRGVDFANISKICHDAFVYTDYLTSITLPASLVEIEDKAFANCSFSNISVDSDNKSYYSVNNCVVYGDKIVLGCKNSVIPTDGSITQIGAYSFYGNNVTEIFIPDSISKIGDFAFAYSMLANVSGGAGVEQIGERAFLNCPVETIDFNSVKTVGKGAFMGCEQLTNVGISSVITIDDSAFSGDSSLVSINLGENLTNIGSEAFKNCVALSSITLPSSLTRIGVSAFYGCGKILTTLDGIYYVGAWAVASDFTTKSASIKEGTVGTCDEIFKGVTSITSAILPSTLVHLGAGAFENCAKLEYVYLRYTKVANVRERTFKGCTSLNYITFDACLASLGNECFYDCSALETIAIPTSYLSWQKVTKGSYWNYNIGAYTMLYE